MPWTPEPTTERRNSLGSALSGWPHSTLGRWFASMSPWSRPDRRRGDWFSAGEGLRGHADGDADPVPGVDGGDQDDQLGELLVAEVLAGLRPHVVRHARRALAEPRHRLGQRERG